MVIFLWTLAIAILIIFIFLGIFTAKLKVEIKNLEIKNKEEWNLKLIKDLIEELERMEYLTKKELREIIKNRFFYINYDIQFNFYMFSFIKIFSLRADNNTIKIFGKSINRNKFIEKIKMENMKIDTKMSLKDIRKTLPRLEKLKLYMKLGTEEPIITAILTTISNTFLVVILSELSKKSKQKEIENWEYAIVQNNFIQNSLNLILSCIIEWKFVHIMYIFKLLKSRRVKKNGKSSDRRSNEKCYG